MKCLVKMTCGRVLVSLSSTATDSLCSMQDDGIVMHHHTSVSCSKVCSNTSTYLLSSINQCYYSYNICFMTNTFYLRNSNRNVDSYTVVKVVLKRRRGPPYPQSWVTPGHSSDTSPFWYILSMKNLPLLPVVSINFRHYNNSRSYYDDIATYVKRASGSRAKHW